MSLGRNLAVVAVVALATVLTWGVGAAWGHDYADAHWYNTSIDQGGSRITTTISPVGAYDWSSGGFVSQVVWTGTAGATDLQDWVELGYTKGWEGVNILTFYWADQRPGLGYFEHKITAVAAVVGVTHTLEIAYIGNDDWNVNIDGSERGQSTSNPGDSYSMATGLETTSLSSYLPDGDSSKMNHRQDGKWYAYWGTGTVLSTTAPPCTQASWVTARYNLVDSLTGC